MGKLSSYPLAQDIVGAQFTVLQGGKNKRAAATLFDNRYLPSIKAFGALGDGATNDNAAFVAAAAGGGPIFTPPGDYLTGLAPTALPGRMWGEGYAHDANANKRARFFSRVDGPPASLGNGNSIETAFNGDWSRSPLPIEHRIYGTMAAGVPTTGYSSNPEIFPVVKYGYNEAGHNESTSGNDGRTGIALDRSIFVHKGGGDYYAHWVTGSVSGARAGASSFLANPAAVVLGANLQAGADGVYLNPVELDLFDAGFDAAAIGPVINMHRTNDTGNLGAVWYGHRVQINQSVGAKAIDGLLAGSGPSKTGLDLSGFDFSSYSQAALILAKNQRIYSNVTPHSLAVPTLGSDYFMWSDTINGWVFVVGGSPSLQVNAGQVTTTVPTKFTDHVGFFNTVPGAQPTILGSRGGNAALADLLTKVATLGLWIDGTSA